MSRPGNEPWPPRWEASTLEKSNWNSLFNCYSEPLQAALNVPELATLYSVKEYHSSDLGIEEDLEDSDEAPVIRNSWRRETHAPIPRLPFAEVVGKLWTISASFWCLLFFFLFLFLATCALEAPPRIGLTQQYH